MKLVQVRSGSKLIYRRLVDDGSNTLRFESGSGFVSLHQIKDNGWTVELLDDAEGWELRHGWGTR